MQPIIGFGVAKVLDSGHPSFKKGDLVWGNTKWKNIVWLQILNSYLKSNTLTCLSPIILAFLVSWIPFLFDTLERQNKQLYETNQVVYEANHCVLSSPKLL